MITAKCLSTILIRLSHQASRYLFLFIFVLFLSCVLIKPFCKRIVILYQTYLVAYHIFFFLVLYILLNGLLVVSYCCDINLWTYYIYKDHFPPYKQIKAVTNIEIFPIKAHRNKHADKHTRNSSQC